MKDDARALRKLTYEEETDPRLAELRQRVQQTEPHRPQPGDPDYQTPTQVAAIKRRLRKLP